MPSWLTNFMVTAYMQCFFVLHEMTAHKQSNCTHKKEKKVLPQADFYSLSGRAGNFLWAGRAATVGWEQAGAVHKCQLCLPTAARNQEKITEGRTHRTHTALHKERSSVYAFVYLL